MTHTNINEMLWTSDNVGDPAPPVARVHVTLTSKGRWEQSITEYHEVEFGHYPYLHLEPNKKDKFPLSLSFIYRNKTDVYGPKQVHHAVMPGCETYTQKWCVIDKPSDVEDVVSHCKEIILKAFDELKAKIDQHIEMIETSNES